MLETFLLEQLDAFARYGTVSAAAKELCLTQPAMSRNLKKIEQLIGVKLFERRNGRLFLNETGKVAAKYAHQALESIQRVTEMTRAFDSSQASLALGVSNIPPAKRIVRIASELFPDKEITTILARNDELLSGLRHGRFDLAVFHGLPDANDVRLIEFMRERLCVSIPRNHPLSSMDEIFFSDLENLHVLAVTNAGIWAEICSNHLIKDNLIFQTSVTVLPELNQLSSLPSFCTDAVDVIEGGLQGRDIVPISDDDAYSVYYLGCLESESARFKVLFDAIEATIA